MISNVQTDDEYQEEVAFSVDESQDEQIADLNGFWDFILPISNSENEYEALPISTRTKGLLILYDQLKNINLQLALLKIKLLLKNPLPLPPK